MVGCWGVVLWVCRVVGWVHFCRMRCCCYWRFCWSVGERFWHFCHRLLKEIHLFFIFIILGFLWWQFSPISRSCTAFLLFTRSASMFMMSVSFFWIQMFLAQDMADLSFFEHLWRFSKVWLSGLLWKDIWAWFLDCSKGCRASWLEMNHSLLAY